MIAPDPLHYGWWLAGRASGIVALALVTLSVGIGLAMAGRVARRPGLSRTLMALHEHAALAGLVAIAVHGVTLLLDPWLHPGPAGVAVPFTMGYRPLFTGLGVVAAYLAALLGLSFYARRRIGARLWRKAHRATVLVYLLGVVHASARARTRRPRGCAPSCSSPACRSRCSSCTASAGGRRCAMRPARDARAGSVVRPASDPG